MRSSQSNLPKIIIVLTGIAILVMGIVLFIIPPALFPDPANGFQVLRSAQLGGGFNNMVAPDQSDISQDYSEFLTWWSPGQYLIPYFFKLILGITLGQGIAITVTFCTLFGLIGFYYFFRKLGFDEMITSLSLLFILCQVAFFVPFVYYNGGEILLFAFMGWFLYGCLAINKTGVKLVLFVLLSGWIGFFFKSSFVWMYIAGLCCLWLRLVANRRNMWDIIKKGLWVGIPALVSLVTIYVVFLSKGRSPASGASGLKLTAETFGFPLASPLLSDFSIDDFAHGLFYHFGPPLFSPGLALGILLLLALMSVLLIMAIVRRSRNNNYRLFIIVFYVVALFFFGFAYLRQLNISYEARHYRVLGILIIPGMISLLAGSKIIYKASFAFISLAIAGFSVHYLFKGYYFNHHISAKGPTGIAQPNIDQTALNKIMQLDRENKDAIFVFISNDIGLEISHNRIITLPPIGDNLKIDMDEYAYEGFAGPLYIVLPETYNGPKEKMIMKSFPGYTGFNESMLSNDYVLYSATMKRVSVKK